MFVYLDETESGNGEFSGYASLISKERINRDVIDDALANLEKDEDRYKPGQKQLDDRTLDRGYFHAADDSKNAHSHFCTAINKHVIGDFKSHIFHTKKHNFGSLEEIYDLTSKLAVVGLFSESRDLTLIFEGRNGLSTKNLLEKWWPDLWGEIRRSCYSMPFAPLYYPNIKFEISGKDEPGSQVVDFMLWAAQRAAYGNDTKWYDRLNGWAKGRMGPIDGGWNGHNINRIQPDHFNKVAYSIANAPTDAQLQEYDIIKLFVNVQKIINRCFILNSEKNICHIKSDVDYIYANRLVHHNVDFIKKMADCFIKIFDNLPIIGLNSTPEEKTFWIAARKFMAFSFHDGIIARFKLQRLSDIRHQLIENHPELLD